MDVAEAYRRCARITRREARNFHYAFRTLPKPDRHAIYALYAFCREADDLVDSGTGRARQDAIGPLRDRLTRASQGAGTHGIDRALSDAMTRYGINPSDLNDMLTGLEMDLSVQRIEDEAQLDEYAYHVASAVGLATLPILNGGKPVSPAMRAAAVDLGKGMQYVNILRDVAEDLSRNRIYLPRRLLTEHGVDETTLFARVLSPSLRQALAAHADRARDLLSHGRALIPQLPPASRSCPWLLAEIYGRILARIERSGFDVFAGRVSLPRCEKLWLLASSRWTCR